MASEIVLDLQSEMASEMAMWTPLEWYIKVSELEIAMGLDMVPESKLFHHGFV